MLFKKKYQDLCFFFLFKPLNSDNAAYFFEGNLCLRMWKSKKLELSGIFSSFWYFNLQDNEKTCIIAEKRAVISLRLRFCSYLEHSVLPMPESHLHRRLCGTWECFVHQPIFGRRGVQADENQADMCGPHSSQLQKAGTLIWVAEFLVNKGSKFMWSEVNSLEVNLKHLISKLFMFSTLNWLWAPCMKEKEKNFTAEEQEV